MNRLLSGRFFWPLTERLRHRDTMRRFRELRRTESFTREEIRTLQERKLRHLLRVASEHCPFYARRLAEGGVDPTGAGIEDLLNIPTITRQDIHDNIQEMTWLESDAGAPRPYTTGGSSGEPLRFYTDASRQAADWAARWRARGWWGIRPGDREIWLWGAPVELCVQDRLRRFRDFLLNQEILSAFEMSAAMMDAYTRRLRTVRPVCVFGYASSLALLARHALDERGLAPGSLGSEQLRAVFTTGEVLLEADREQIAAAFGAPIVVEYGSRDGGLIGCGCPAGLLHIPEENVIVELLDADGRAVAPGEVGEVVVTCLETFAMPVIRYRIGDLARDSGLRGAGCSCGMAHSSLSEVRGRLTDQIVCRKGGDVRRMHALSLIYVLREADGLQQFRITQPSIERLEVDVVCGPGFTSEVEGGVHRKLSQRMGEGVEIEIRRCERIAPTASGKHACVVSHVK